MTRNVRESFFLCANIGLQFQYGDDSVRFPHTNGIYIYIYVYIDREAGFLGQTEFSLEKSGSKVLTII